jgi:hypothetical protein
MERWHWWVLGIALGSIILGIVMIVIAHNIWIDYTTASETG